MCSALLWVIKDGLLSWLCVQKHNNFSEIIDKKSVSKVYKFSISRDCNNKNIPWEKVVGWPLTLSVFDLMVRAT